MEHLKGLMILLTLSSQFLSSSTQLVNARCFLTTPMSLIRDSWSSACNYMRCIAHSINCLFCCSVLKQEETLYVKLSLHHHIGPLSKATAIGTSTQSSVFPCENQCRCLKQASFKRCISMDFHQLLCAGFPIFEPGKVQQTWRSIC